MVRTSDVAEVERFLAQGRPVVDVLPADSFRRVHIPGAKSAPLEEEDFDERIQEVAPDKDGPVVVYCSDPECQASPKAADIMEARLGYRDVRHFEGGLAGWRRSGREFEGEGRKRLHAKDAAPSR